MRLSSIVAGPGWLRALVTMSYITGALAQDAATTDPPPTAVATMSSSAPPTTRELSTSTSLFVPQTHTIQVGLLDHKIRPETTVAAVGDTIEFNFYPVNHSIVRAGYGFPCIPYEMTGSGKNGFFSGFNPVGEVLDNPPKYSVRINDTEPIFFYCSAPGSCITWGMVGGINLNSSMSIDSQRALALDSAYMLQPGKFPMTLSAGLRTDLHLGEPFPAESPLPSNNPASSILPSSSSNSATVSPAGDSSPGGLSAGAIAGIVVAAFSALLFGALLFFCWGRTKSLREAIERKDGTVRRVSGAPDQMVHHVHNPSHGGFQFPPHPAVHPGSHPSSPDLGTYGHQHNASMSSNGYFPAPAGYMSKYASPTARHPVYHALSPGIPAPGSLGLNGHPFVQ